MAIMRGAARWCGGLAVLIAARLACAQTGAEPAPAPVPVPVMPPEVAPAAKVGAPAETARDPEAARDAAMAQLLDPSQYDAAFYSGAQAELVVPSVGASALLFGYDAVWTQIDLSLGLGVGGDPLADTDTDNIYVLALRLAFPVHRGIRADYSLFGGVGATFIDPTEGSNYTLGTGGVGARFRVFMTPSVAVGATLGVLALIRGDSSSVLIGARPLGAASVVYFFR